MNRFAGCAERFNGVDVDRQLLVVDHHQLGGILGHISIDGDDRGNRLALIPHLVEGENVLGSLDVTRQCRSGDEGPAENVGVATGGHRHHSVELERFRRVDAQDPGVGERAPHERHVQHAR